MPLQRILNPHGGVLGAKLVDLQAVFTFGSTNAVSSVKGKGFTTASYTDSGLGQHTIVLPGTGTLDIYEVSATYEDGTLNMAAVLVSVTESTRTIVLESWSLAATPVAADPTSGGKLRLKVTLKESSQP